MATSYTVKAGDNLNKIAAQYGFKNYKEAGISGFDNPDAIKPGQVLSIGGVAPAGPTTQEVPGIGTLKITPKTIPQAGPTQEEDLTGAYKRAGINPPAGEMSVEEYQKATGTGGYKSPEVPGLPQYPQKTVETPQTSMLKSYQDLVGSISEIEKKISSASVRSDEEVKLANDLAKKRAALSDFDLGTMERVESLYGQGRGATVNKINLQESKERRTSALERLGFAQEVDTLANMLALAKEDRKDMGDLATTQYNLATKRFDMALGLQKELDRMNDEDKTDARQYLLDVVSFAEGKSYDQLDADTQAAVVSAVADSPITLGMVKTALQSSADKAAAAARGELRTVPGVGIVQVNPTTGSWKVVVPENPTTPTSTDIPTFEEYLSKQNIPFPAMTESVRTNLKAEYDAKYGNSAVTLGKLTADNRVELNQAGLIAAPAAVQSYFLNSPSEFQDEYQRKIATGEIKDTASLASLVDAYTAWFNNKNKSSGARDWSKILGTPAAQ